MTGNPKVSVIVPVYNVEKYLPRCLDSILSQTLRDIEILAIDDGSTDSSPAILDRYESEDKRVKVFHIQNGGVSHARNIGLDNACGDFVGFVDSDDMIDPDMYSVMVQVADRDQSECVQCAYDIFDDGDCVGKPSTSGFSESHLISGTEKNTEALFDGTLSYSIWNKIYRRSLIDNHRFNEDLRFAEDFHFNACIMLECSILSTIDVSFYHYYMRNSSLTHDAISDEHLKGFFIYGFVKEHISGDDALKTVSEKEVSEGLRLLDSSIGHSEISKQNIKMLIKAIKVGRKHIFTNRFMGRFDKIRAFSVCLFPDLYVFAIKVFKRLR